LSRVKSGFRAWQATHVTTAKGEVWPVMIVVAPGLTEAVQAVNRALGWRAVIQGAEEGVLIEIPMPAQATQGVISVFKADDESGEQMTHVAAMKRRGRLRENPWRSSTGERNERWMTGLQSEGGHRLTMGLDPAAWEGLKALSKARRLTYKETVQSLILEKVAEKRSLPRQATAG